MTPLLALLPALGFAGTMSALADDAPAPPSATSPAETALPAASPPAGTAHRPIQKRPALPRAQTDFTAYTLEWGEARVGLGGVAVGVLPRTQLGTLPLLDALGMPNASVKVNAVRAGGFDLAAAGSYGALLAEHVDARWMSAGGAASLQIAGPWSVHVGGSWVRVEASGAPQLDAVAGLLGGALPSRAALAALEDKLAFDAAVSGVTARAATDVRINRRDSLVIQAHALLWSSTDLPPLLERVVPDREGAMALTEVYTASVAWQLSWRNVDARIGLGVSSVPGAWLTNTVDLAWRFGGPTRRAERRAALAAAGGSGRDGGAAGGGTSGRSAGDRAGVAGGPVAAR